MDNEVIRCPGGETSQTGLAVRARYPGNEIAKASDIEAVLNSLETTDEICVVPIWNSYKGEIPASTRLWNLLIDSKVQISDLWPKSICFWLVVERSVGRIPKSPTIGSVIVAKEQCSEFIKKHKAVFKDYLLTNHAIEQFAGGNPDKLDGVLVAPGYREDDQRFQVIDKETANERNFTSFVAAKRRTSHEEKNEQYWLTAISIGALNRSPTEDRQEFFSRLFSSTSIDSLPKITFVFNRESKIGLLLEGEPLYESDLLDVEEIEAGDIFICEKAGNLANLYSEELNGLVKTKLAELYRADFFMHRGNDTFMFACPALGLYTQGFEENTVEQVVVFYIMKIFELLSNTDIKRSHEQQQFFNRYEAVWKKRGRDFIRFSKFG